MSYVQAEFRRRNCRPIFSLSNQCCKADCLENTVDFSGCIRPTVSFLLPSTSCGTSKPGLLKALSRAASAAEASILRLRLHSTLVAGPHPAGADPPPAPAPAAAKGGSGGKGCCCARNGGGTGALLNLLPLMNSVLWDAKLRLQFADLGCIWNRWLQLADLASNMS